MVRVTHVLVHNNCPDNLNKKNSLHSNDWTSKPSNHSTFTRLTPRHRLWRQSSINRHGQNPRNHSTLASNRQSEDHSTCQRSHTIVPRRYSGCRLYRARLCNNKATPQEEHVFRSSIFLPPTTFDNTHLQTKKGLCGDRGDEQIRVFSHGLG